MEELHQAKGRLSIDEKPVNQSPKQLIPYQWKKGQSGNPNGRPKGPTLKEFARNYLMSLPDDEKIDFLAALPPEIVWKMAEGNPHQSEDITSGGKEIIGNTIIFGKMNDEASSK